MPSEYNYCFCLKIFFILNIVKHLWHVCCRKYSLSPLTRRQSHTVTACTPLSRWAANHRAGMQSRDHNTPLWLVQETLAPVHEDAEADPAQPSQRTRSVPKYSFATHLLIVNHLFHWTHCRSWGGGSSVQAKLFIIHNIEEYCQTNEANYNIKALV